MDVWWVSSVISVTGVAKGCPTARGLGAITSWAVAVTGDFAVGSMITPSSCGRAHFALSFPLSCGTVDNTGLARCCYDGALTRSARSIGFSVRSRYA